MEAQPPVAHEGAGVVRVSISSDYRYCQTPDGVVWTDGPCHYRFLTRYLTVFDRVNVIARMSAVAQPEGNWQRADGAGVSFSPLPFYLGPLQYLLRAHRVRRAAREAVSPNDALILNAPGQIGSCVATTINRSRPYAVQVLGDPYDVFAPGVIRHPLRGFLRWWCSARLRHQVRHATAALYVTQKALQARYPCAGYSVGISDVDLPPEAFVAEARSASPTDAPLRLVSVGTMTQMYKGFDVLIDAVAQLVRARFDVRLVLVGDGQYRATLEQQVRQQQLSAHVSFRGQLATGARVRDELDAAQLFVLPSRTEGLPRALVEAMARGLPCLASRVGGIPELLPDEDMLLPGDATTLAVAIRRVASDPHTLISMSRRNLAKAAEYRAKALGQRRTEFYRHLADCTATWLAGHAQASVHNAYETVSPRTAEEVGR